MRISWNNEFAVMATRPPGCNRKVGEALPSLLGLIEATSNAGGVGSEVCGASPRSDTLATMLVRTLVTSSWRMSHLPQPSVAGPGTRIRTDQVCHSHCVKTDSAVAA